MELEDDVGIMIRNEDFYALIKHYLERMNADDQMTANDYVEMVRLWNTIELHQLGSKELFGEYASAFFPNYIERVSTALNAKPTKGMALYSEEYDLYVGGRPHPLSQYKLEYSYT